MSIRDAYEDGIDHGWSARNYQEAYGGTCEPDEERVAALYEEVEAAYYRAGFELGAVRFENGEWHDGAPMEPKPVHRLVTSTFGSLVYCETCGHGGCEDEPDEEA